MIRFSKLLIFIFFIGVIFIFLPFRNAIAAVHTQLNFGSWGTGTASNYKGYAKQFTLLESITFDSMDVEMKDSGTGPAYVIQAGILTSLNDLNQCNNSPHKVWGLEKFGYISGRDWHTETFNGPEYTLQPGTYYVCTYNGPYLRSRITDHLGNLYYAPDAPPYGYIYLNNTQVFNAKLNLAVDELLINTPYNGQVFKAGATVNFTGECPVNGVDRIARTWKQFSDLPDSDYTIDCINNAWSDSEVLPTNCDSGNLIDYVMDKNWETDYQQGILSVYMDYVYYSCVPSAYEWNLTILYPTTNIDYVYNLQASDVFPFRISYSIPSNLTNDDVSIYFQHCTDSTCVTRDQSYLANTLTTYDADNLGYINTEIPVVNSQTDFYVLELEYNPDIMYRIQIKIVGDANGLPPTIPGEEDLGWLGNLLRKLFVPRAGFLNAQIQQSFGKAQAKVPFYYYYQTKTNFENVNVATENVNLVIPLNVAGISVNMPILNNTEPSIINFLAQIRPWLKYFIWSFLAFYLVFRAIDLKMLQ